jgi:hypothetical protein
MRLLTGGLVVAAGALALTASVVPASAAFSDQLCPEATQYVVAITSLPRNETAQKVYDAAHATTTAYDACAKRHLADANVEPGVHYAYTRQASFEVVEARALLALNRPADAKALLENAKRLAQDVFEWRRAISQKGAVIASSGSDNRPSVYHDAAKEIIDSVNDMLAKLPAPTGPASGAPAMSPAPRPSPAP